MKKLLIIGLVSLFSATIGGIVAFQFSYSYFSKQSQWAQPVTLESESSSVATPTSFSISNNHEHNPDAFVLASSKSTSSVVFIQTVNEYEYRTGSWLDWFFDNRYSQQTSTGSGVIVSDEGYIVTNNHVVNDADLIRVISGKKTYEARLIGRDPSTDLAIIKIEGEQLQAIEWGNSDKVNVGEWVLAVGNPFNLTSTVTAGIVSAKGRNINLLEDKFPIESFIQTDAAINPGNSGGALVNTKGQLIGINTAILSRTGSYAGYGFAVPVNIVKKVYHDIIKYGEVQKAFIGVDYIDINSEISERFRLPDLQGVLVVSVDQNSASDKAGILKGDIIRKIDNQDIENKANLEEIIGNKYPGDTLHLTLSRDGKIIRNKVILTNREGGTGIIKRNIYFSEKMQVRLEMLSHVEKNVYGLKNGVKVLGFEKNGLFAQLDINEGFIITQVNNTLIHTPQELEALLENIEGRVRIYGVDKKGRRVYYPFWF